ncbi:MAG: hypothetical protein ABIO19_03485 [Burkholderiaceae bacterium]
MTRLLLLALLYAVALPASAIYKCKTGAQVTYSDTECANAKAMATGDRFSAEAAQDTRQRLAADKAELNRLRNERKREEAIDDRSHEKYARAAASKRKHCAGLEQSQRWAKEDVAIASKPAMPKAHRKAQRAAEKYAVECGK